MRKLTQLYRIEIQQIIFYFTNLICENLCCLCYLRAFDTTTGKFNYFPPEPSLNVKIDFKVVTIVFFILYSNVRYISNHFMPFK